MVVVLQMLKQMQKCRFGTITLENMVMLRFGGLLRVNDMAEKLFAQIVKKIVFGFKMCIERGTSYVGAFNDLSNSNSMKLLLG